MQKTITLFIAAFFFTSLLFAQAPIPNYGFENWAGLTPTGWGSSDGLLASFGLGAAGTAERDTNAANVFSGTSSVKLTNKFIVTTLSNQNIPGAVSLGLLTFNISTLQPSAQGVPYTDRPDSIRFAAKLVGGVNGADTGNIAVTLTKWTPTGRLIVARTVVRVYENPVFTVFTNKIEYHSTQSPDTVLIQAISSSNRNNIILESQMWVDDFSFIGLDSVFNAYLNPYTDSAACAGDTITLITDPSANNTFQWYKDNTPLNNETQAAYHAVASGHYYVEVNKDGNIFNSDTVAITIHPLPQVTFTLDAMNDTLCSNGATILLTGGSPANGSYMGNAVTNSHFNPAQADPGLNQVIYTYMDNNGCTGRVAQNIFVTTCLGNGITETAGEIFLPVYPNPNNGSFEIDLGNTATENSELKMFDASGKMVYAQIITESKTSVAIPQISAGMYLLQLKTNAGTVRKKIVVEK